MAITVNIGELTFNTKKATKQFFKDMLGKYQDYETINDEDTVHLQNLIERHPEAQHKIGCGVERFYRAPTDQGTSCFWLERSDKSTTDFSYLICVDAKGKSLYQEFAEACRASVKDDLHLAKINHFEKHSDENNKVPCDITDERIGWSESHLDHKKPMTFQVIVRTFIVANNLEIKSSMLSFSQDAQFTTTFRDKEIENKFRKYHHSVADLRIIKAKYNLSLGNTERITKSKIPVSIPSPRKMC